jgi:flagellar hook-associated protein FlgK
MGSLGNILTFAALLAMAAATSIAVATSYYLYRWRRILSVEGKLLAIPEELIARLATVDSELKALRSAVSRTDTDQMKQRSQMHQAIDKTNQIISQLFEASATMQNALDQRDGEIKRLREGYDAQLVRRFVGRFIRVKQAVRDAKTYVGTDMNTIDQIDRLLDDALDECGVEEFRPKLNEDFRVAAGVADNPQVIETADASKNFRIVDVLEPGYRFRNGAEREIILSARVSIYVARNIGD